MPDPTAQHGFSLSSMLKDAYARGQEKIASAPAEPPASEAAQPTPPFVKESSAAEPQQLDYAYFEKLAGAVEYATDHLDELVDGRSNEEKIAEALVIAELHGFKKEALKTDTKDSGNAPAELTPPMKPGTGQGLQESPAPSNAMENTQEAAPGGPGEQPYKHDKAKTMTLPTDPKLESPELTAGDSTTALPTDENEAPGNNTGPVPTTGYPDEGVFKEATAKLVAEGIPERFARVMAKQAMAGEGLPTALASNAQKVQAAQDHAKPGAEKPDLKPGAAPSEKTSQAQPTPGQSPLVSFVLRKLAEDNSGAKPSAGKGGTTVDGGDFPGTEAGEGVPEKKTRGQDSMVASSDAAIQYTKRDAKKEPKKDLGQVLDEPAQSKATDSKLQENLGPVADSAGAKIASDGSMRADAARELLRRVLAGDDGPEKEAALKQAMAKLGEDVMDEVPPASDVEDTEEVEREQAQRSEQQFADVLADAARATGEGTGEPVAPAAAPDVPATV